MTEYDYDTDIAVQREEAFNEGISVGISKGTEQAKIETARNMLKNDISLEIVAQCTELPLEKVKELSES